MSIDFRVVNMPGGGVYRLARRTQKPFAAPDWQYVGAGRFDDPRGPTFPEADRFRVIYCASTRLCCFAETFRVISPVRAMEAVYRETDDSEEGIDDTFLGTVDPEFVERGLIAAQTRQERRMGRTFADVSLNIVDITAAESLQVLERALQRPNIDLSVITSDGRQVTQACARFIYEQRDDNGVPRFAGIRYVSHLDASWECWAVFADRFVHHDEYTELTINPDDLDLVEMARIFHQTIEVFPGHFIRP